VNPPIPAEVIYDPSATTMKQIVEQLRYWEGNVRVTFEEMGSRRRLIIEKQEEFSKPTTYGG
jgi:hypothetical protein